MADRIRLRDARSFTMVYNDFFRMPQDVISYYDKLVFIAIKSHAGASGSSFPSINTLHRETGISRQKIQESIAHLVELGFLRKEKRQSNKYGNISNLYTIYETEEMCKAGTPEAVKKAAETSEEDKAIETLARLGYTVIPPREEKEPSVVGATEGSGDDKDNSISVINCNSTHKKLQEEKYSMDDLKEMMDYDVMISSYPDRREYIDAAIFVIYNSVNSSQKTLRVGQEDRPASIVIGQLLKLDHMKIMECIDSILEVSKNKSVSNIQAYLLTTLYNAVTQPLRTASQVAYDTNHWREKDRKMPDESKSYYDND